MKRRITTFAVFSLIMLLSSLTAEAHTSTYTKKLEGPSIAMNSSLNVEDDWYNYMQTSFDWCDYNPVVGVDYNKRFTNYAASGKVSLSYTGTENRFYGNEWQLSVKYDVVAYNSSGQSIYTDTDKIIVSYDPEAQFIDHSIKAYPGAHRLTITIVEVEDMDNPDLNENNLPNDFVFETTVEIDRYFILDTEAMPDSTHHIINTTTGTIEFLWEFLEGAEEYELQYVHVSDLLETGTPSAYKDFKNATRIFVTEQSYKTHLACESGVLYFRVRGVGKHGDGFNERLFGVWSSERSITISEAAGTLFEDTRNWTYQITYAEFGKRSEVVSFFDGGGQSRQSITLDNTTNVPIVAESFMDYEGRPAVSVLPSPVVGATGNLLEYYNNFVQTGGGAFDKRAFDLNANRNAPSPLDTTVRTAGNFYSPNNPLIAGANPLADYGMNQNIADAQGYAFTRVLYDNEGRVEEQSGVGAEHRIDTSDSHTTQYFYGSAPQEKLDRLFGSEVGYAQHYRKKMVQDPNGQLSVSYENLSGQVIATAFVGNAPKTESGDDMVDALVNIQNQEDNFIGTTTEDLTTFNQYNESDNEWNIAYSMLVSSVNQDYEFDYVIDLGTAEAASNCNNAYGCIYDLRLKIVDPDGDTLHFTASIKEDGTPTVTINQDSFPIVVKFPVKYEITFSVNVQKVGNYRVIKELRLRDVDVTFADYLAYISDTGNDPCDLYNDSLYCSTGSPFEDLTNENPLEDDADCNSMYETFKDDLSPEGQYFYNLTVGKTSPDDGWLTHSPRNVPDPDLLRDDLEDLLNGLGAGGVTPITITDEAEFWQAINDYFHYPEVEAFLHNSTTDSIPGSGLEIWRYHPEYPHWVWCNDTYTEAPDNAGFNTGLAVFDSIPASWIDEISTCAPTSTEYECTELDDDLPANFFPSLLLVDNDPYFSSVMGDRTVNSIGNAGTTGEELMSLTVCSFPVEGNECRSLWEKATDNAMEKLDQQGIAWPTDTTEKRMEIWEEFRKLYLAQKDRIIKLQKKNPCDNPNYSPFLFDESNLSVPSDFVADCPREQDYYLWGSQPYDLGDPYNSNELHDIYDWFDNSCSSADTASLAIPEIKKIMDWWGSTTSSPCNGNSGGENRQLTVTDHRALQLPYPCP